MKERILASLKDREAFVEVRIQKKNSNSISFKKNGVDKLTANTDVGGFVRALYPGGGWGIVTFNSLESLDNSVNEAILASKAIVPEESIVLADIEPIQDTVKVELEDDFREHSLEEKIAIVEKYNNIIKSYDERIIDTNVSYGDNFSTTWFANTEGSFIVQERAEVIVVGNAIAREGDNVQTAHKSFTSRNSFSFILNRDEEMKKIAKLAIDLLSAKPVEGGVYPVVLNPNLSGVFIHEAFGHLSEADNIVENPQAQKMMTLGRKFGPESLNVYDDGTVTPLRRGTIFYDDEGVPAKKNPLIVKGELVGRLHSRESSAKLSETPTGNARAMSYDSVPLIRMTNTYIEKGDTSFEDMIKDIKIGVYALDAYGGQTMLENFSFSAGYGYMIRDGKIAEMVKDVVLQGNLFTTLANIEAIGDDFTFGHSGGNCGKGGQSIPVSMGSPHIRIKDVMVGGKK